MIHLQGRFLWALVYEGHVLSAGKVNNGIATDSIDDLLDTYFSNGSTESAWYLGLIAETNFDEDVGLDADDTMASHAGWEEATNYNEATRPAWAPDNASDGLKRNVEAIEFTITSAEAIRGMFVCSDNTKGGSSGTLWATGEFTTSNTPPVGAVFKLFYELEAREG